MSYIDLQPALCDWPYEPDKISVRKILGADATIRLQMRVELGIVQMEADGRPDGVRPHNQDSLLDYHRARLATHEERNGTPLGFSLSREDCHSLRLEASLYYRRYVAYFVLEEYGNVIKDTVHNLAISAICREFALEPEDRLFLDQYTPYILMMDARARAYLALEEGEPASALAHVNRGILDIKNHLETTGLQKSLDKCEELRVLRAMAAQLSQRVPQDSLIIARKALRDAIEQERFEEAARLRDELKNLYGYQS